MEKEVSFWSVHLEEAFERLGTSKNGLSSREAQKRIEEHGKNELAKRDRMHGFLIFISQFRNPLVLILIGAAIISFFLNDRFEAIVIISIVLLTCISGFFQEYKAEGAIQELRKYIIQKVQVLRDGIIKEIDSRDIALGDIVILHRGDIIPADMRLIHSEGLTVDESPLTGESFPVEKLVKTVSAEYKQPQQLDNMAFMGTIVASGTANGVVTATASDTFLGKTSEYLKEEVAHGEFQKNIFQFSNFLLKMTLIITILIFAANALLNKGIITSFLFALALAVGITPEVLPVIMTATLSAGAIKMAKDKVVTKKLESIEDFGNIDTLCCDKTGTLTEGKLALIKYLDASGKPNKDILLYGLLCNSIKKDKGIFSFDNPIDKAIWECRDVNKIKGEINKYTVLSENEFDFERRRMSTLLRKDGKNVILAKGSVEAILQACKISAVQKKKVSEMVNRFEEEGYKSIAVAKKRCHKNNCTKADEAALELAGFLFFLDPPKKTVKKSLQVLNGLGVAVKVITGDSPTITRKICNEVNLLIYENKIVTGDELSRLDDNAFNEYCKKYNVFSRVSPQQKYEIVESLRKQGDVVGFLGDGINDAPALHAADVGISVDTATPIAKDAADIILLKKSLNVLAHGIIEGRKTFANINKYILNTISANFGNMFTFAMSSIFLKFIPLLPSQILLNNFLSDVPLLTLYRDSVDNQSIKKPKHWNLNMISHFMYWFGGLSTFFDLFLIIPLIFLFKVSPDVFRTSWFLLSILSEIAITFAIRTKLPFYKSRPNNLLAISSIVTAVVSVIFVSTYLGSELFGFAAIPLEVYIFMFIVLILYFTAAEIGKRMFFKKYEL